MAKMKDKTFEEALLELEKIVEKLEVGDLPLTESLKLFEEGIALSRFLREELDKTEKRVEILLKGEGKELRKELFELEKEIEKKSNNE